MGKWPENEVELLKKVREKLKDKLADRPQYVPVVGDNKLIRFIRGHNHDFKKICEMVEKYLDMRKEKQLDEIYKDIIDNNLDHPTKFPNGKKILELDDKILMMNPKAVDNDGTFVSVEGVLKPEMFDVISIEEYIRFRMYCMEYISMLLTSESFKLEKQELARRKENNVDHDKPYGQLAKIVCIRDTTGLSIFQFNSVTKNVSSQLLKFSTDNYPELLKRVFVINTGFVFTTVWAFVKMFLVQKTVDKIKILGSDWKSTVLEFMPESSLLEWLGGTMPCVHEHLAVWEGLKDDPEIENKAPEST